MRTITTDAVGALESYDWRGNVRELRNLVFRLALLARDDVIDSGSVRDILPVKGKSGVGGQAAGFEQAIEQWIGAENPVDGTIYHAVLAAFERPLFEHALRRTEGNQVKASQVLGINRNTLRKRLSDLEIDPEAYARRR